MKPIRRTTFRAGLLLIAGIALAQTRLGAIEISTQSPFMPRPGSGLQQATENSPVEFRGTDPREDGLAFGLFDPVKKKGAWLKLNEKGKDLEATVHSYDPANSLLSVEYQGRRMTIPLKAAAKIEAAPAMAMVNPVRPTPMPGQPAVAPAPSADDTRRLEAVAAEVARRRQARQAAAQQQQLQPQQPAPQVTPVPNRQR